MIAAAYIPVVLAAPAISAGASLRRSPLWARLDRVPAIGAFLVLDFSDGQRLAILSEIDKFDQRRPNLQRRTDQPDLVVYDAADILLKEVRFEIVEGARQAGRKQRQRFDSLLRARAFPRSEHPVVQGARRVEDLLAILSGD